MKEAITFLSQLNELIMFGFTIGFELRNEDHPEFPHCTMLARTDQHTMEYFATSRYTSLAMAWNHWKLNFAEEKD